MTQTEDNPPAYTPPKPTTTEKAETSIVPPSSYHNEESPKPSNATRHTGNGDDQTSAGSSIRKKPVLTHLSLRKPLNPVSGRSNHITIGEILLSSTDILLLTSTTTFSELITLLLDRAQTKKIISEEDREAENLKVYRFVSMKPDRKFFTQAVGLDEGNWEAGREMLLRSEEASLTFGMAVVKLECEEEMRGRGLSGYVAEGSGKKTKAEGKRRGKCVLQ